MTHRVLDSGEYEFSCDWVGPKLERCDATLVLPHWNMYQIGVAVRATGWEHGAGHNRCLEHPQVRKGNKNG